MSTQRGTQPPAVPGSGAQVDARRRKLVALGASSSLLLTIASRPAWAGGNICSPSALASANLSGQHSFTGCGISAGWWGSPSGKSRWPVPLTTPFLLSEEGVFGDVSVNSKAEILFAGLTLEQVIDNRGGGGSDANPGNIGLHLVGAYLNAMTFPPGAGPGYVYSVVDVILMYNSLNGAPVGHFGQVKDQFEYANNLYDGNTDKPL